MKSKMPKYPMSLFVALGLTIATVGCESTDDSSSTNSVVTGTWFYSDTRGAISTWALVHEDDTTVSGAGTGGEAISGTLQGDAIYISLAYDDGAAAYLNGTVSGDTMAGTGTYTTNSVSTAGSWTAVRTN